MSDVNVNIGSTKFSFHGPQSSAYHNLIESAYSTSPTVRSIFSSIPSSIKTIYVGDSIESLSSVPGFADYQQTLSLALQRTVGVSSYDTYSGVGYIIVEPRAFVYEMADGSTYVGNTEYSLLHEIKHATYPNEPGSEHEQDIQYGMQKVVEELHGVVGKDYPDVAEKGTYSVKKLAYCFLAGSKILMADGRLAAIEGVRTGDRVAAFSSIGSDIASGKVVRTFIGESNCVIDFHGLKVTSGHKFLNEYGEFEEINAIICRDGCVVSHNGCILRARTLSEYASKNDAIIPTVTLIDNCRAVINMRAGVPYGRSAEADYFVSLEAKMTCHGYRLRADGLFENEVGDVRMAAWEWGDPREHPIARNYVVGAPYEIAEAISVS